jgi:hypothetical protein
MTTVSEDFLLMTKSLIGKLKHDENSAGHAGVPMDVDPVGYVSEDGQYCICEDNTTLVGWARNCGEKH